MADERIDFSVLRHDTDQIRWQRLVRSTLKRLEPTLAAWRQRLGTVDTIASWSRPLLSAAAVIALVLLPAAFRAGTTSTVAAGGPAAELAAFSLAEVQGVAVPDAAALVGVAKRAANGKGQ